MEKTFAKVYLKKGCSSCDRISTFLDQKKYHVERRWVDEPGVSDELTKEAGKPDVPALNASGRWLHDSD
jgi:hypothetical protein